MSTYTTEVRFICESSIPLLEQGDLTDVNKAIEAGRKRIFTFDYDLFDPLYKPVIETKFLRHYYVREIGMETVGLWKLRLEDKWTMLLPYYNKLWESELLKFNPLYDVDYTVENTGDRYSNRFNNGESESKASGTNKDSRSSNSEDESESHNINKFSDTPQGGLDGVIETDWLTNATEDNGGRSGTSKNTTAGISENESLASSLTKSIGNIHDIDDYMKHVSGKMGRHNYSQLLLDFRKTFLNIDKMFIDEMNDLFMLIY